ncbi:ribosome biogenesis GTPase YlqF [Clostridiales bacterium COT073_COT-073]|nr:ribosome biogenesis GTPase YlqF [Clostridiales bacterium COT073_COT-073]
MNIQWYPGHMTKARRMMAENLKLIDIVIELVDARAPISSSNPDLKGLTNGKEHLVILTKPDLASIRETEKWLTYFKNQGKYALEVNSKTENNMKRVQNMIDHIMKPILERYRKRGLINKPVRAMIVGIPNVGKSTFINKMAGKNMAKTGNKPGVTKGKQWIKLRSGLELLDTPGVLWPKFEDQFVGRKLAYIGTIREEVIDSYQLALSLFEFMAESFPREFAGLFPFADRMVPVYENFEKLAVERNFMKTGGEADVERLAHVFLENFRNGKYGRFTLETTEMMDQIDFDDVEKNDN